MIGVFDSGSGGLTIMRALDKAFPDQFFLYLGDHANAPYGDRNHDEIYGLTLKGLEILFALGCKLVIVACNTAAATGLRQLQRQWLPLHYPEHRVLGVIVPVVEEITGMPWKAEQELVPLSGGSIPLQVAVFATNHTVSTRTFSAEIHKRAPYIQVYQQACPDLVPMIEAESDRHRLATTVRAYVEALQRNYSIQPDVCILGCTHYPLIESLFRRALPPKTRLLSQPEITARALADYLNRHCEFSCHGRSEQQFLTTGDPVRTTALASRFYGRNIRFIKIPDYVSKRGF